MRDYADIVSQIRIAAIGVKKPSNRLTLMQDAADAIEELLKENGELENSGRVLMAAFARLKEKVPTWISVVERLPVAGERVLVSNGGFVCESFLSKSGKWQRGGVDMFFMTPTHWCEMPESPKEENKR